MKKMKGRTKIQWMHYLRENFWRKDPFYFYRFRRRKWRFLKKRFRRAYFFHRKRYGLYKKKYNRRNPYRKKRHYYRRLLKEKHRFKLYYDISSEKKFKKILRKSLRYKKQRLAFYNLLTHRLDSILVLSNFVKDMKMAKLFIENNLVFVNGRIVSEIDYRIGISDIISISEKIKTYILNRLRRKMKRITFCKKKRKKRRRRRKVKFLSSSSSFFEINYKTLEIIIYNDFKESFFKIPVKMAFDLIRRAYRR
jgi:ribosomal protein S4